MNGTPVKDGDDLVSRVADTPIGTPVTLTVDRDGKKMDFNVTIMDRAEVFKDDPRFADLGTGTGRTGQNGSESSAAIQVRHEAACPYRRRAYGPWVSKPKAAW